MFPETERLSEPVLLGSGALGQVYRAEDTTDGSILAVRVLPPAPPWAMYRLKSGFSSLQSIDHQNLVRPTELHDAGEPWFIMMAHVDGPTLPEWLKQHTTPGALQEVFGQLTRGLMALHQAGLLHRNLKPSNVRVNAAGVVKLLAHQPLRGPGASHIPRAGQRSSRLVQPRGAPPRAASGC